MEELVEHHEGGNDLCVGFDDTWFVRTAARVEGAALGLAPQTLLVDACERVFDGVHTLLSYGKRVRVARPRAGASGGLAERTMVLPPPLSRIGA